jgi:hypothetical protein
MSVFIAEASKAGDVLGSVVKAGVSLVEYLAGRQRDAVFAAACVEVDQAARIAAVLSIQALASSGNVRAAALLIKGLGQLQPADELDPHFTRATIPVHVWEAMYEAGQRASGREPPPAEVYEPHSVKCPRCHAYFDWSPPVDPGIGHGGMVETFTGFEGIRFLKPGETDGR